MSSGSAIPAVETCEIVWWRGYVRGRFLAYVTSPEGSRLIAESAAIPWRSASPPGPTDQAVEALDELTARLVDAGFELSDRGDDAWFRYVLSRPATAGPPPADAETEADAVLDTALLEQLRIELAGARHEARRERDRRVEAETKALRLVQPADAERARSSSPPAAAVLRTAYAVAVAGAALVGLVAFESAFGAAVAALTVLALAIAVDSWLAARRRTADTR